MDDVFKVPKPPSRKPRQIRPLTENSQNVPKRKIEPELKAQPLSKIPTRPPSQRPKRLPKTYQYYETTLFPKLETQGTESPDPDPAAIKSELSATKTPTSTVKARLTTVAKTVPISSIKPGTSLLITKTGHTIPRLITSSGSTLKAVPSTSLWKAGSSTAFLKAGTSTSLMKTGSTSLLKTGSISTSTASSVSPRSVLKPGVSLLKPGTSLLKSRLTRVVPSTSLLKPGTSLLKSGASTSLLRAGSSTSLLKTGSSSSLLKVGSSTLPMNAGSSSVSTGSTTTFINLGPSSSTIYAEPSTTFIDLGPAMFPINAGASTSSATVDPPALSMKTGSETSDIQPVPSTSTMREGFASLPKDSGLVILATEAANLASAAEAKKAAAEAKKAAALASGKRATRGRPPGSGTKGKGKAGPTTIRKVGKKSGGLPASAGVAGPLALRSIDSATKGKPPSSAAKAGPSSKIKRTSKNSEALVISNFLAKIRSPDPESKVLNPDSNVVRQTAIDLLKDLIEKTNELEEIKEEHSELKNKHKHLEWDFYKLTGTNIDLSTYNTNLNLVNTQLTEQLDSLASELRAYEIDHKKFEAKEHEDNMELTKLKNIEQEYCELKVGYDLVTNSCNELNTEIQHLTAEFNKLRVKTCTLQQEVIEGQLLRRKLHNTIQELRGNIQVYCRVRAPSSGEYERPRFYIGFPNNNSLEVQKSKEGKPVDPKMVFLFDKVFRPVTTQTQCFEELVQFVQSALDGYDVCVLAYGQTGSGKTYTLRGYDDVEHCGLMNRAVTFIFKTIEHLRKFNWTYEVKASFIEIYNECLRDLLNPNTVESPPLDIKVTNGTELTISNLRILPIESFDAFSKLLKEAERNRSTSTPDFSDHCNKSHAVYKVSLIGKNEECNGTYTGSLTLVDLAGSEWSRIGSAEKLQDTAANLPVLGSVLIGIYNKEKIIPYRSSKLTYLLQLSLGGSSKTLLLAHLSPFEEYFQESMKTLRFASKIKEVKSMVKRIKALPPPQGFTSTSNQP